MKKIILGIAVCFSIILTGCSSSTSSGGGGGTGSAPTGKDASAGKPSGAASNAQKIVGKWEGDGNPELPPGMVMEFSADGKVLAHLQDPMGKSMSMPVGTYKVEGDKLTLIAKKGDKDDIEVNTIKSLTDDSLVLIDTKGKETKEIKFKKKK